MLQNVNLRVQSHVNAAGRSGTENTEIIKQNKSDVCMRTILRLAINAASKQMIIPKKISITH